jgi:hypothetical protein
MSSGSADDNVAEGQNIEEDYEQTRSRSPFSAKRWVADNVDLKIDKMDKGNYNVPRALKEIKDPQKVKHSFVCMYTGRDWIGKQPYNIDVSDTFMMRADGGDWHGRALYTWNEPDSSSPIHYGQWVLRWPYHADLQNLQPWVFRQIARTNSFLNKNEKNPSYNSVLIPADTPSDNSS